MIYWIKKLTNNFKSCISLISSLPAGNYEPTNSLLNAMFFVTALLQGLAGILLVFRKSDIDIAIYILIKGLLTGWLHEDALIDCADASEKPTIKARLRTLKTSNIGSYGSCTLNSLTLLEYTILKRFNNDFLSKSCMISSMISYLSMMWHWRTTHHVYDDAFKSPKLVNVITWTILSVFIIWKFLSFKYVLMLIISQWLLIKSINTWTLDRFGGQTGDSLGSIKKLSEILCLLILSKQ
ncbi:MAG: adenosylcobinamide-GDP ribazoletransferase [Candidatus Hodgkinia cicadicola]